jgi:hypothetical protein
VGGRLQCVGNPRDLVSRFGGYLSFTITTPPAQARYCPDVQIFCVCGRCSCRRGQGQLAAAASPPCSNRCPHRSPARALAPSTLQEAAAAAVVRELAPSARLVYALGGTQKFELPTGEASVDVIFRRMESVKQRWVGGWVGGWMGGWVGAEWGCREAWVVDAQCVAGLGGCVILVVARRLWVAGSDHAPASSPVACPD